MVYDIHKLIRSGVPAEMFSTPVEFHRLGTGKYHVRKNCRHRLETSPVLVDVRTLREKDLCANCAKNPSWDQTELKAAVAAGHVLVSAYEALEVAGTGPSWVHVATLEGALDETAALDGTEFPTIGTEVAATRGRLLSALARQTAQLSVDVEGWTDVVDLLASPPISTTPTRTLPADLLERLAHLYLPPYSSRYGPRDGAWILRSLRAAIADARLDGMGWEAATSVAQQRGRQEVETRGGLPVGGVEALDDVVAGFVQAWRTSCANLRTLDAVGLRIVLGRPTGLAAPRNRDYHRLLAPAMKASNRAADCLAAVAPRLVAESLVALTANYSSPKFELVAPAEPDDTREVLEMLVRVTLDSPALSATDALDVARALARPACA